MWWADLDNGIEERRRDLIKVVIAVAGDRRGEASVNEQWEATRVGWTGVHGHVCYGRV